MDPRLVYDVGVHRGDDTAYYLHKGYRVVGVEADPAMADHLRDRFSPRSQPVRSSCWRLASPRSRANSISGFATP